MQKVWLSRMITRPLKILLIACVSMLFFSCSRPTEGEEFLSGKRESYDFTLPVEDSLSRYDLSFYTRIDGHGQIVRPLRLDVTWQSPQDSTCRETVYMPLSQKNLTVAKYRTSLRFPSSGNWALKVAVSPQEKGFRGLGLSWKEYRWDTAN